MLKQSKKQLKLLLFPYVVCHFLVSDEKTIQNVTRGEVVEKVPFVNAVLFELLHDWLQSLFQTSK